MSIPEIYNEFAKRMGEPIQVGNTVLKLVSVRCDFSNGRDRFEDGNIQLEFSALTDFERAEITPALPAKPAGLLIERNEA